MLSSVFAADEHAVVVDTTVVRADLATLAYALVQEGNAEAIMIISNPEIARKVRFAMQVRKVPILGAIFHS